MGYPENDEEFTETTIDSVEKAGESWAIHHGGWMLHCGDDCPIEPKMGQIARLYGRGIGAPVRGLFINGQRIWYRTEAAEKEHFAIELYGADATDWLARWDAGRGVWSIEMGGIGPGYEQCIQITAAEIVRWLLAENPSPEKLQIKDGWRETKDRLSAALLALDVINSLGLSGAQWGAALSLGFALYLRGPRDCFSDPAIKDRLIQVSRKFPGAA